MADTLLAHLIPRLPRAQSEPIRSARSRTRRWTHTLTRRPKKWGRLISPKDHHSIPSFSLNIHFVPHVRMNQVVRIVYNLHVSGTMPRGWPRPDRQNGPSGIGVRGRDARSAVARDQARAEFGTLVEHGELAERDAPPHSNSAAQSGIGAVGSDPSEDLRFFGPAAAPPSNPNRSKEVRRARRSAAAPARRR